MEFHHVPILLQDCVDKLQVDHGGVFVDCTLGGGGHSQGILNQLPKDSRLFGIDRDQTAINAASSRLSMYNQFTAIHGNFFDIKKLLKAQKIDFVQGILADLGVSSHQLDEKSRGFSYQHDARLDMRMDVSMPFSAYEIVNEYTIQDLSRIIREYGEEKWASRIAKFIVQSREEAPIETTFQLVEVIKAAIPASARREGPHPAKRTFQAIRIEVNAELDQLEAAIEDMIACLAVGGRLAIITFHSLEDRIVKQTFARLANPCTCPPKTPICICNQKASVRQITRKPISPSLEELTDNPRARSAKLRVVEKIS